MIEPLIERYNTLNSEARIALQVLSILYDKIHQNIAIRTIDHLNLTTKEKSPHVVRANSLLINQLIKINLIIKTKQDIECNPLIVEYITRESVKDKLFNKVFKHIERSQYLRYYGQFNIKLFRLAFYACHNEYFFMQLQNMRNDKSQSEITTLLQQLILPIDKKWWRTVPDNLFQALVLEALYWNSLALNIISPYLELLQYFPQKLNADTNIRSESLAYYQFIQNSWHKTTLPESDNETEQSLYAAHLFLQGDCQGTQQQFTLILKKKPDKTPYILAAHLPGVFYILSLLDAGQTRNLVKAEKIIVREINKGNFLFTGCLNMIKEFILIYLGQKKFHQCSLLSSTAYQYNAPETMLFHALILTWLDKKLPIPLTKKIKEYALRAETNDWQWFASFANAILQHHNKRIKYTDEHDWTWLLELVPKQEQWKSSLKALQLLAGNTEKKEIRIAWLLTYNKEQTALEPREQKKSAKGIWSKGRVISFKKLLNSSDQYPHLTQQDLVMCNYIGEYRDTYYRSYIDIDISKALIAAIEHPHLYWADNYKIPIELKRAEVQLEVLKNGKKITLNLNQNIVDCEKDYILQKNGLNHLSIIPISEKLREISDILGNNGLTIPDSGKQQMIDCLTSIAPLLTVHSEIEGMSNQAKSINADATPCFQLQPYQQGLKVGLSIQPFGELGNHLIPGKGSATLFTEIKNEPLQTKRNLKEEVKKSQHSLQQCPILDPEEQPEWLLEDPEDALEALSQLQQLAPNINIQWPKGQTMKIKKQLHKEELNLVLKKQNNWFELEGSLTLGENDVLSMQQLLALIKQSTGRFLTMQEGEFLELSEELYRSLKQMRALADHSAKKTRFHPLTATVLDEITEGMSLKTNKPWNDHIKTIKQAYQLQPSPPSTLQAELRDYQLEGFRWLMQLAHWGAGACLADDMGLGKTIQALALIITRAENGPTLVLAPTSVCFNWFDECQKFAPTLNPQIYGTGNRNEMLKQAGAYDLIICSYGLLHYESEALQELHWHTIIADEAQAIKNPLSKRAKAASQLNADFKMITTGTPIENHLGELWSLFHFINPGLLGSLTQFNQRYANPIQNEKDDDAQSYLKRLLQPFILRRLKTEVLQELPSRTEITLHVELSSEETALYEAMRRQAVEEINNYVNDSPGQKRVKILAEIMRLRRACCNPKLVMPDTTISSSKLKLFSELIDELLDNHHKALVFSQFVGHLSIIRQLLDDKGIRYQYLDGSTPNKQRKSAMQDFQKGIGDIFLISLKAGGSGLNLTAADYVIHMDPWWNPAVEDQASDRAHRIGQKRPVTIYRLVAKNTIEDKIVALHKQKRDLANNLLAGSNVGSKINVDDMIDLLNEID